MSDKPRLPSPPNPAPNARPVPTGRAPAGGPPLLLPTTESPVVRAAPPVVPVPISSQVMPVLSPAQASPDVPRTSRGRPADVPWTSNSAYLTQSLQVSYRVERWRRNLALTQAAIVGVQKDTRIGFGLLVKERRTAAGLSLIELSRLAGLDDKTIGNVEQAGFFISRKSIEALIAVPQLRLSWADVGPELLEENPADGRKHKRPRRSKTSGANPKGRPRP